MSDEGEILTNADIPYYKQRSDSGLILWWMWHGNVGHWVLNCTPGQHGSDILKSDLGDFACPEDKTEWEIITSGFTIESASCCTNVEWDNDGVKTIFADTGEKNNKYPLYKSGDKYLWWMWHKISGNWVGHWVING